MGGRKQLTHLEFVERVFEVNPNIIAVGRYIRSKDQIEVKCKICGREWMGYPTHLMRGIGCAKCSGRLKRTHMQYITELAKVNPNVEAIEKYISSQTPVGVRCKICGHEWNGYPNHLLRGVGCIKCSGTQQRTHDEFVELLDQKNPMIEVIGQYVNRQTNIKFKCKLDGNEWETDPGHILSGTSCPQCAGNQRKDQDTFIAEMAQINPDIEILGRYESTATKLAVRCRKDGYEWKASPNKLLYERGCPKCKGTYRRTHDEFVSELQSVNSNLVVKGAFKKMVETILVECLIHQHEWNAFPNNLLRGHGCPVCNESKGEKAVRDYLDEQQIVYQAQWIEHSCKTTRVMPFDFYIPSKKLVIEYQGRQHFEFVSHFHKTKADFVQSKKRDELKRAWCIANKIRLLEISYLDYKKIPSILKTTL